MKKKQRYVEYWLEFLISMTEKEIKARYRHAWLGFLWVGLNPLLQMLVIGLVFQFFVPVEVDNYFLFLFAGLLPWNFFSMSVIKATPSIVFERSLIQKAKFPREAIILSIVLSNLFHLIISLGLLVVVLVADKVFFDHYSITQLAWYVARMIWLGPALVWLALLTSGLSLLTAAWNVQFRDVGFMVGAIIPLWFYATPIIYTVNLLPRQLQFLAYLNPMTAITQFFHFALLNQAPVEFIFWAMSFVSTLVVMGLGVMVFYKEAPFFDDWI